MEYHHPRILSTAKAAVSWSRGSLEPIFRCLDKFDVAMKMNLTPVRKDYEIASGIPGELFPVWNSGVIFFRNNDRASKLFAKWSQIFLEEGKKSDQLSLARAIYQTPEVRLLTLGVMWNAVTPELKLLGNGLKDVKVWHYRHPHKWPDVAPALYKMHLSFNGCFVNPDPSTIEDIESAAKRHKFLSSPFYRFSVNNSLLMRLRLFNLFIRAERILKVKIRRPIRRNGKGYSHLKQKKKD